jgi:hypothetical protein
MYVLQKVDDLGCNALTAFPLREMADTTVKHQTAVVSRE